MAKPTNRPRILSTSRRAGRTDRYQRQPTGRSFMGNEAPQWVPEPGLENLIIQWQNTVPNSRPLRNRSFAAARPSANARSETRRSSSSRSAPRAVLAQAKFDRGRMIGMHAAPRRHHMPQQRLPETAGDRMAGSRQARRSARSCRSSARFAHGSSDPTNLASWFQEIPKQA